MIGALYWGLVGLVILCCVVLDLRRQLVLQNARLHHALMLSEVWRHKLAVNLCLACDQLESRVAGDMTYRVADWREVAVLSQSSAIMQESCHANISCVLPAGAIRTPRVLS